jgi:hypothetical protein
VKSRAMGTQRHGEVTRKEWGRFGYMIYGKICVEKLAELTPLRTDAG